MPWSLAKALSHLIHDANTGTANRQLLPVTLSYFPHVLLSTLAWPIGEEAPQGPLLGSLLISLTLPCSPQRTAKCPPPSSVLNPRSPQLQTRCPPGWFWPISQKTCPPEQGIPSGTPPQLAECHRSVPSRSCQKNPDGPLHLHPHPSDFAS